MSVRILYMAHVDIIAGPFNDLRAQQYVHKDIAIKTCKLLTHIFYN